MMAGAENIDALATAATLPEIQVNNRALRKVSADASEALHGANTPPVIFTRGDDLVRVQLSPDGSGRVVVLGEDHLRGHLTRAANFIRLVSQGKSEYPIQVSPPRDVARDLLTGQHMDFPHLNGVIASPVVRADGSVFDELGYDPATGLYYAPPTGFVVPAVPGQPTRSEVAAALGELTEVFADFPYQDQASRANALACLLTPVVRPMIAGQTPLALVDSPEAGTGKGLHVAVSSLIATGSTAAVTTAPRSDEEWRKRITSLLLGGQDLVLLDNIEGVLQSPSLAAAITAPVWQDRFLGQSRQVTLPVRVTWTATGNNIKLGGDLPRRAYWIRLDAKTSQPWRRSEFRHPNLLAHVQHRRAHLVWALLSLVRAWVADGRPEASVAQLGSFEEWARVVGGVLGVAEVHGFLGNLDQMHARADVETPMWTAFLEAWRDCFGDDEVTAATVIEACAGETPDRFRLREAPDRFRLREALPDEVGSAKPERRAHALGTALSHREERRYGDVGLRVVRCGTAHRAVCWKVICG